jgi:hypothetical protein
LSSFGLPRKNKKKKKKKSSIGPASDGAGFHTTNISEKKEQLIRATFILKSKQQYHKWQINDKYCRGLRCHNIIFNSYSTRGNIPWIFGGIVKTLPKNILTHFQKM